MPDTRCPCCHAALEAVVENLSGSVHDPDYSVDLFPVEAVPSLLPNCFHHHPNGDMGGCGCEETDAAILERLEALERIIRAALDCACEVLPGLDAIPGYLRLEPLVPAGREARPLVDAPPGARDMFACPDCRRQYFTMTEATECHSG